MNKADKQSGSSPARADTAPTLPLPGRAAADTFTATEKLAGVERELAYRRRVYPRMITEGGMSSRQAARQIALFEQIADDYRALAKKERLL